MKSPQEIADEIIELFQKSGTSDYIGEAINQLEHASQCAELAMKSRADDEVILAAFFHDIGHLINPEKAESMGGFGVAHHEMAGAQYLREKGFSERLCHLVEGHVATKRYLTGKHPEYLNSLSPASHETLKFQGGPMTPEEVKQYESNPDLMHHLSIRSWDDQAKLTGVPVIEMNLIKQKIVGVLH